MFWGDFLEFFFFELLFVVLVDGVVILVDCDDIEFIFNEFLDGWLNWVFVLDL